ncbi:hypothetical protein BGP_6568 [Beggiatoa sp. PS]|nr:hypothetical protein BGP_6568 [Beggiatoa sp. PS]
MSEKRMLEKELFEKPVKPSENSFMKKFQLIFFFR